MIDNTWLSGESWQFVTKIYASDGTIDNDAKGNMFLLRRWLENEIKKMGKGQGSLYRTGVFLCDVKENEEKIGFSTL